MSIFRVVFFSERTYIGFTRVRIEQQKKYNENARKMCYAPGLNTGYAAVVFPGVLDALEKGDDAAVRAEIDRLVEAFSNATAR